MHYKWDIWHFSYNKVYHTKICQWLQLPMYTVCTKYNHSNNMWKLALLHYITQCYALKREQLTDNIKHTNSNSDRCINTVTFHWLMVFIHDYFTVITTLLIYFTNLLFYYYYCTLVYLHIIDVGIKDCQEM